MLLYRRSDDKYRLLDLSVTELKLELLSPLADFSPFCECRSFRFCVSRSGLPSAPIALISR